MKTNENQNSLSKHLLTSLDLFQADEAIKGPKGDEYHHFLEVHVLKGDDDYKISNITSLSDNAIQTVAVTMSAPTRLRGMSGVCIIFWSEEEYIWTRSLFFHKGCVYQEDKVVQENATLVNEGIVDEFTKPAEEHY